MFKYYSPKGRSGCVNEYARLTNMVLRFSEEAWSNFFQKPPFISLYHEEESRAIGLKPCEETDGSRVTVRKRKNGVSPEIFWQGFSKSFCLSFEKPRTLKFVAGKSENGKPGNESGMVLLKI